MEKYEKKDYKKNKGVDFMLTATNSPNNFSTKKIRTTKKRYGFPNQKKHKNKTLLHPQHLPSLRPKSATNLIINQALR